MFLGCVLVPCHLHLPALVAQVKSDDFGKYQFFLTGDVGFDLCESLVGLVGLQCVDSAVGTIAEKHKLDAVEA